MARTHIRGGALTEASGRLDHNGCRNELVASDGAHGGDVWSMGGSEIPSSSTFRVTDAISFLHCASEHTSRRRRIFESIRKPVSSFFGLGLDVIEVPTAVRGWPGSSRLLVLERINPGADQPAILHIGAGRLRIPQGDGSRKG